MDLRRRRYLEDLLEELFFEGDEVAGKRKRQKGPAPRLIHSDAINPMRKGIAWGLSST